LNNSFLPLARDVQLAANLAMIFILNNTSGPVRVKKKTTSKFEPLEVNN
jgi:hypothetical protein